MEQSNSGAMESQPGRMKRRRVWPLGVARRDSWHRDFRHTTAGKERIFWGLEQRGAGQISSGTPFCRINAAFHLATERRIYAGAKNSVVRPIKTRSTLLLRLELI